MESSNQRFFKVFVILIGVIGSFYIMFPFLSVILLAGVCAFTIDPHIKKIKATRWFRHSSCIYALIISLFFLIAIPFITMLYKIYSMILALDLTGEGGKTALAEFNQHKAQIIDFLNNLLTQIGLRKVVNIESMINLGAQQVFGKILQVSTYLVTQIPELLFSFGLFLVALFLFTQHSTSIGRAFYSLKFVDATDGRKIVQVLKVTSYSAVFSSLVTGFIQAVTVSAGAGFFLDVDVTLIFILTFFCSFIPVIGAAPIAFLLAVFAWSKGQPGSGLGLIVIGVIAGTMDNLIRVWLLKAAKDDLHPFVGFLSVIGGVIVLGLPGLFLGPVIVSATAQLVPILLTNEKTRWKIR